MPTPRERAVSGCSMGLPACVTLPSSLAELTSSGTPSSAQRAHRWRRFVERIARIEDAVELAGLLGATVKVVDRWRAKALRDIGAQRYVVHRLPAQPELRVGGAAEIGVMRIARAQGNVEFFRKRPVRQQGGVELGIGLADRIAAARGGAGITPIAVGVAIGLQRIEQRVVALVPVLYASRECQRAVRKPQQFVGRQVRVHESRLVAIAIQFGGTDESLSRP